MVSSSLPEGTNNMILTEDFGKVNPFIEIFKRLESKDYKNKEEMILSCLSLIGGIIPETLEERNELLLIFSLSVNEFIKAKINYFSSKKENEICK